LVVGLGRDARAELIDWAGPDFLPWSRDLSASATGTPAILLMMHPAYMFRKPASMRSDYVCLLADAMRWAFKGTTIVRKET
jgi:hypothetical protein